MGNFTFGLSSSAPDFFTIKSDVDTISTIYRGTVGKGFIGSMEPKNFYRRILGPIRYEKMFKKVLLALHDLILTRLFSKGTPTTSLLFTGGTDSIGFLEPNGIREETH